MVGQPQHDRPAAPGLGARGDHGQAQGVGHVDQPGGQPAVVRQKRAVILRGMPVHCGQAGQGGDAAGRAIVEAADVGGIGEAGDVPVERVVLAEPAAQLRAADAGSAAA
jgi:hypothetical protein